MSNTVITNYTDLNGPSTKAESSVVVIVNKDGSLSVDQNLLGTLMGNDGSQGAGISVVRVGHEGAPDDATDDSETENDGIPHVTLSVDSYYDEPNSIIKYDSGAEMLQSLRIETRENSLVGFQNDHCYTSLTSPSQSLPSRSDSLATFDEPVIQITHTPPPPPKPISNSKKISILDQHIITKSKKLVINPHENSLALKGNDLPNKAIQASSKSKHASESDSQFKDEESESSSSISSSDESVPDRDSDSDYKETKERLGSVKVKKNRSKPRILKGAQCSKLSKFDPNVASRLKSNKNIIRKEIKEKIQHRNSLLERKQIEQEQSMSKESVQSPEVTPSAISNDPTKGISKLVQKQIKKEKKTPAHMTALLSDMTSLFSTPDVIRRVSTDNKLPIKNDKEFSPVNKKSPESVKPLESVHTKLFDAKPLDSIDKSKPGLIKTYLKPQKDKNINLVDKVSKGYDLIPQLDDASLAQILQDTTGITPISKSQPNITTVNTMNSPGLTGPLSPTLDLLGVLQPEEEGLTEDLLMHVAQLVESSENLQEVIDKQVLGKVDTGSKLPGQSPFQQTHQPSGIPFAQQGLSKGVKTLIPRKDPIEIVRRDGRVITLPPIEAPATRSSKRKSQIDPTANVEAEVPTAVPMQIAPTPEPQVQNTSKQYVNKKLINKKSELVSPPADEKMSAESQESWNSEDDPHRLWCICKQPHNNRFMICCDSCGDWFHGKCVNISKAVGQEMEGKGIEWRCPNCTKKSKPSAKIPNRMTIKRQETEAVPGQVTPPSKASLMSKTGCIVCKKPARASSIYCSDACILKHAQDSLGVPKPGGDPGRSQEKHKSESRVIVYERKSGRLLAGPNAPTAENLKAWLQKNPTFEVVRPGTLSTIKPNMPGKKPSNEPNRIQTTLNFERIPRKLGMGQQALTRTGSLESKEGISKSTPAREEPKHAPQVRTPVTTKTHQPPFPDTPKASTSAVKSASEPRKIMRAPSGRSQSTYEKAPSVSPAVSRRKDTPENKNKMNSDETIRENVRKTLQEQLSQRMAENKENKFSENEIKQFALDMELELHELFRDVGMKYKAKYRSLMFNIKDRKNLSLWQKICDRSLSPKQLVRLSPEELASQELAQWRDKETKYQLELIKKSELDLLAASKTYVLKTHKGEEVMETKTAVSTELDPNMPVEDVVTALNDAVSEDTLNETLDTSTSSNKLDNNSAKKHSNSRKREKKDAISSDHSKRSRNSKRESDRKKSRSAKRSEEKERKRETRRSSRKSSRTRSISKERSKVETSKSRTDSIESSERRSRSRGKSKKRSHSREYSRSRSSGRNRSRSRSRSRSRPSERVKHSASIEDNAKQRSRSQENVPNTNKTLTDTDTVERPKSAMLKEAHPEYDPHEPMITSAFSEEDLRKSEEAFEDTYKNEIGDYEKVEFDASKSFFIDSSTALPSKELGKRDKASEGESDQEPSSTVDNSAATVWNGCINMVDVARFYVAAHEVSGSAADLEEDLSTELDIVGRINPETVWDYISKMKRASNKDIIILRLQAANDEEKMQYIALYSYLSSRNRLGVVKVSNTTTVKDFYIVPLSANTTLPQVLLPLDGPGLGEVKTHLLIAIVIRQRKKRMAPHIPKDLVPAKLSRKRSYTPPVVGGAGVSSGTGLVLPSAAGAGVSLGSAVVSTPPRRALPLPAYTSPALSSSVKDKIAASLAAADDEEAYSPGSSSSGGSVPSAQNPSSNNLRCKMEELNRQIEEQKQQIMKMAQADSSQGENEAYSPSRPMTPPRAVPLADIALPSNLHEILATIKQRSETHATDVDMRTLTQQ